MKFKLRGYDSLFILLFVYLFILQLHAIWSFTIDDMYISLRYAKHWASGNGLLWNIQEPPVEGYSNFSFVALAAVTLLLNNNPVIILKCAGVLGLFLTCYFIYLLSRFWFGKRQALLPCVCLLAYKGQIIWATSGLETTVYEALISGGVYFCLRGMGYQLFPESRGQPKYIFFITAGLMLSLAGLTRPEAPVLMALFCLFSCLDRPKINLTEYWRGVFLFCMSIALLFAPYFIWRSEYFGYLVPNSVYCKGYTKTLSFSLDRAYLKLVWPFILFSLPACIRAKDKRHYFFWTPSLVYLLMLAGADPVVAFDNRLFLPAFILLLPLSLQGMRIILVWCLQRREDVVLFSLYILFAWIIVFFTPKMTLAGYRQFSKNPVDGELMRSNVVRWLNKHTEAGDTVVLADSGMIPYQSNLNFIDSYCLNNVIMAHYPAQQRYLQFCQQVFHEQPEVIILTSLSEQGQLTYTPADNCLKDLLDKQKVYKFDHSFIGKDPKSTYHYELYTK